jgi:hypothetical protein
VGFFYFVASSLFLPLHVINQGMKFSFIAGALAILFCSSGKPAFQGENIEFVCYKTHKASNTCHFNFVINGAKYRHVDMGCKFSKKKEEAIKKVKEGSLALAKDWKIDCPEAKEKKENAF